MSGSNPVEQQYLLLQQTHTRTREALLSRRAWLTRGLAVSAGLIAIGTLHAIRGGSSWPLLLGFAVLLALIPLHLASQTKIAQQERLHNHYDRALLRVRGEQTQSGSTGAPYRHPEHLYEHDLNLLGPSSLFGLLDTVRTGIGQRGLADYLQTPVPHATSVERQAAVRELTPLTALREHIALLGQTRFQQVEARFFDSWLDEPAPPFPAFARPFLALTATAQVALLLLGVTHVLDWSLVLPNFLLAAVLQSALCLYLQRRVKPLLTATQKLSNHVQMFSEGLALLDAQTFTAPLLLRLQAQARQPGRSKETSAVLLLRKLQSQVTVTEQRTKELFYIFSLVLAAGTQAAITLSAWKRANNEAMRQWLSTWAEFEALAALSNFAFENPTHTWPELLPPEHRPTLEATALAHPLLPAAIENDISLSPAHPFYLISGSNMSGKSTLLRSIGINAVLAYAGAPVRATHMRLTPLRLGAALALTDSLAEGKSKFLAEVDRLQRIVSISAGQPVLFLVDEIFSGTNSADRRLAASAVLRALLAHAAIGALSTHDLALTDLANEVNGGENVHMASPDPADPLAFDYRLKPGVNTSSNALAIIRMMGLEA